MAYGRCSKSLAGQYQWSSLLLQAMSQPAALYFMWLCLSTCHVLTVLCYVSTLFTLFESLAHCSVDGGTIKQH